MVGAASKKVADPANTTVVTPHAFYIQRRYLPPLNPVAAPSSPSTTSKSSQEKKKKASLAREKHRWYNGSFWDLFSRSPRGYQGAVATFQSSLITSKLSRGEGDIWPLARGHGGKFLSRRTRWACAKIAQRALVGFVGYLGINHSFLGKTFEQKANKYCGLRIRLVWSTPVRRVCLTAASLLASLAQADGDGLGAYIKVLFKDVRLYRYFGARIEGEVTALDGGA